MREWEWNDSDLSECVARIYSVATESDGLDSLMEYLSNRWKGTRTAVTYFDLLKEKDEGLLHLAANFIDIDLYPEDFHLMSPWQPAPNHINIDKAWRSDVESISVRDLHKHDFYNLFLKQNSVDIGFGVHFSKSGSTQATIAIHCKESSLTSDYDFQSFSKLMECISPHLRQAYKLRNRVLELKTTSPIVQRYLDISPDATFAVSGDCAPVLWNDAAENLLEISSSVSINRKGILILSDHSTTKKLHEEVSRIYRNPLNAPNNTVLYFAIDNESYLAEVVSSNFCTENSVMFDFKFPAAFITIRSIYANISINPNLAKTVFNLSYAEIKLVQALLQGADLAEYAADSGKSIHTVRTQLRATMTKVGVKRQPDLMRVLAPLARRTKIIL